MHNGRSANEWVPKGLIEHLCVQQTFAPDDYTRDKIGELIALLHIHRPVANNGKHGNLHTQTCGCELEVDNERCRFKAITRLRKIIPREDDYTCGLFAGHANGHELWSHDDGRRLWDVEGWFDPRDGG